MHRHGLVVSQARSGPSSARLHARVGDSRPPPVWFRGRFAQCMLVYVSAQQEDFRRTSISARTVALVRLEHGVDKGVIHSQAAVSNNDLSAVHSVSTTSTLQCPPFLCGCLSARLQQDIETLDNSRLHQHQHHKVCSDSCTRCHSHVWYPTCVLSEEDLSKTRVGVTS